jgi:MFS family permease
MKALLIVLWSTAAVLVDVALARVAFGSIVPSLRGDLHLTLAATGSIATANLIGYAATTPFAAALLGRFGLRKAAFGGHAVAALGALMMIAFPAFVPIVIARVITGAGGAIGLAAALRLALDAMPDRRVFASIAAWSGVSIGLFAAAAAQPVLFANGAWHVAVALWAVLTLIVALTSPRPSAVRSHAPVAHGRERSYTLILGAYGTFGFGFLAFATFLALQGSSSPASRWLSLAIASVVGILLSARVKNAPRAFAITLVIGTIGVLTSIAHWPYGTLLVGIGFGSTPAFATAIARSRAGNRDANGAIAHTNLSVALGQLIGPVVAGLAADRFGVDIVPVVAAAAYVLASVLALADLAGLRLIEVRAAKVQRAAAML